MSFFLIQPLFFGLSVLHWRDSKGCRPGDGENPDGRHWEGGQGRPLWLDSKTGGDGTLLTPHTSRPTEAYTQVWCFHYVCVLGGGGRIEGGKQKTLVATDSRNVH